MGCQSSFHIILEKKKKFHFRSTPQRKWKNSLSHCSSQASYYCSMLAKLTSCRMNWIGTTMVQQILIYKCRTVESNCSSMEHFWLVRQALWNTNVCCAHASKEMHTTATAVQHWTHLSRSDGAFSSTLWPLSSGTAQKLLFLIPQRAEALWTVIWLCHSCYAFTQDKQQGWEQL